MLWGRIFGRGTVLSGCELCWAVYKSGTGTRGRGHRDACVGTWDLGTRDEGLRTSSIGRGDVWDRVAETSNAGT